MRMGEGRNETLGSFTIVAERATASSKFTQGLHRHLWLQAAEIRYEISQVVNLLHLNTDEDAVSIVERAGLLSNEERVYLAYKSLASTNSFLQFELLSFPQIKVASHLIALLPWVTLYQFKNLTDNLLLKIFDAYFLCDHKNMLKNKWKLNIVVCISRFFLWEESVLHYFFLNTHLFYNLGGLRTQKQKGSNSIKRNQLIKWKKYL